MQPVLLVLLDRLSCERDMPGNACPGIKSLAYVHTSCTEALPAAGLVAVPAEIPVIVSNLKFVALAAMRARKLISRSSRPLCENILGTGGRVEDDVLPESAFPSGLKVH